MNNTLKRTGLILLGIFMLPAIFFVGYELSSLNENEEVIQEIYQNQLDAILFSVNQYSEDVVSNWTKRLQTAHEQGDSAQIWVEKLLQANPSINMVFFHDRLEEGSTEIMVGRQVTPDYTPPTEEKVKGFMEASSSKIKRLKTYMRGNYQKVEPLGSLAGAQSSYMMVLLQKGEEDYFVCGIDLNPDAFLQDVLRPKIQTVSREKVIISAINILEERQIYSTEPVSYDLIQQKKPLWLLPNFHLGIVLKGTTIGDLARERLTQNLIFIVILEMLLLLGGWFVFRSIRKQIELAQLKSDFVSNVSHEIRTPLSLISMFAETLEMGRVRSAEKQKEYYQIIRQEAQRLTGIVNTILNFSKMEAGRRQFNLQATALNELVEEVVHTYDFHIKNKGFAYELRAANALPLVLMDREAISEAFINLLDNAIKYSGDQKDITIATGQENGSIFLEVTDKGIGIPEKEQKEVFDKFYRVSTGLVHNTKGTGLGLSLVKQIMEGHGGGVSLKSKPNEGSSFRLTFPVPTGPENQSPSVP